MEVCYICLNYPKYGRSFNDTYAFIRTALNFWEKQGWRKVINYFPSVDPTYLGIPYRATCQTFVFIFLLFWLQSDQPKQLEMASCFLSFFPFLIQS